MKTSFARHQLSAEVCRDLVMDEIASDGPIGFIEMYNKLRKVFGSKRLNSSMFATALTKLDSGIAIIDGVLDITPKGLRPLTRRERDKATNKLEARAPKKGARGVGKKGKVRV